ncbi:MAG: cobalamin-binding protein [Pseudomonadota bacterium]
MRIVSHTCSNTEIVCALGRADWLVGVDDHSDHPPEVVAKLPRVGADLDLDIKKVLALKPDLVITSLTVPGHERCVQKIRETGLPHIVTEPHKLADVQDDIRRIGQALDAETAAQNLIDAFERRMSISPPQYALPVLIEWWPKPVIVPGRKSWVNEMLALVGGVNPWQDANAESLEIGTKQAQRAAPEALVMSWCGVEETKYRPHIVSRREGWQNIPAIKHNRIFAVSEAWLGRPGPRLLGGIDRLRAVVEQSRSV